MYQPKHFEESRLPVQHALIAAHPLATLVTLSSAGLEANHLPLLLDPAAGEFGTLRGHVARANPLWQDLAAGVDSLAIFQGAQGYISPNWYPTKAEHGKAVPTWNYCVVHAHGPLRIIDDAAWVRQLVSDLTSRHEAAMPAPWAMADAPEDYIERMCRAIVGIELPISRLVGKWKLSQNQPLENRQGVVHGLASLSSPSATDLAALLAGGFGGERCGSGGIGGSEERSNDAVRPGSAAMRAG